MRKPRIMRRLTQSLRIASVAVGVLALLPPGAWDLCVGPQGHRALEPSQACVLAEPETACDESGSLCGTECDSCEDTPIFHGIALRGSKLSTDAPLQAIPLWPAWRVTEVRPIGSAARAATPPLPALSSIETTSLRC
jgi:hypothetical protein